MLLLPNLTLNAPTAVPWDGYARPAGPITRTMVHARTGDLALLAGRSRQQISYADYLRARRELTGETEVNRQEALLDLFV